MVEKMGIVELRELKELERRLKRWERDKKVSIKEFMLNKEKQDSIIYNMLIAVQASIDLGNRLLEKNNLGPASTYAEIFEILGKNGLISLALSKELQKLARFRNVLVHFYWDINLKKVYFVLKRKDRVLRKFYEIVKRFYE